MTRHIYSLVLKDELIDKVDLVAGKNNKSRSLIVNEILAEYFKIVTPEYKINRIMDLVGKEIHDSAYLEFLSEAKGNSIQCRASIAYKYNPKIRYMLELSGKDKVKLATLHIISRTQRNDFFMHMIKCFEMITAIESGYSSQFRKLAIKSSLFASDGKKISRDFYYDWMKEHLTVEDISEYLSNYIRMIHQSMNCYFEYLPNGQKRQIEEILKIYKKYF